MYSFISGTIEDKSENSVVVCNNGIGYEIFVSANTLGLLENIGEQTKLYTYLHVREDAFLLFGFLTKEEKNLFLELIQVSGIGSKMAIQILSCIKPNDLVNCIVSGDVKTISQAKGIGKKTAERIVLELKGKLGDLSGSFANLEFENNNISSTACDEAIELLVNMGLSRYDALKIVKQVATPSDTTETIIAKSLKNLG
jgi:Holliday junction DNA helicase RuvA